MPARATVKLEGTFTGTGQSATRTFLGSAFLLLDGDGDADATVALQFSDDDGGAWHGMSIDLQGTLASWDIAANGNVGIYVENQIPRRLFRFDCSAHAAGVVSYALKSRD